MHGQDGPHKHILNQDQVLTDFLHELSLNQPVFMQRCAFCFKRRAGKSDQFLNKVMWPQANIVLLVLSGQKSDLQVDWVVNSRCYHYTRKLVNIFCREQHRVLLRQVRTCSHTQRKRSNTLYYKKE